MGKLTYPQKTNTIVDTEIHSVPLMFPRVWLRVRQATRASSELNELLHTVPQALLIQISNLPSIINCDPTSRKSPSVQSLLVVLASDD